ncbi:MAG: DoxX family protein [Armatimonadota bacterium]|nr:DoxX family protein [Armatimonadota bacterium]MDR5676646.1 DoxX family protein [Armatimonadota bacterium]MDR5690319.1 DoxX family protein [Armatimonadota bacterium]MDR7386840.1 DoxX family protein [Armatimonadota bacterium]MDR7388668.1 DoxX family protein [Armatimonadota bacterium]
MGRDLGLLLVRVALVATFIPYGYAKWAGGMDRFVGLLIATGFPAPEALARAVAALELGGGVLLLLGLGTRLVAALLAAEMAVAILRVLWPRGYLGGFVLETVLLLCALALVVAGGGRWSLGSGPLSR